MTMSPTSSLVTVLLQADLKLIGLLSLVFCHRHKHSYLTWCGCTGVRQSLE